MATLLQDTAAALSRDIPFVALCSHPQPGAHHPIRSYLASLDVRTTQYYKTDEVIINESTAIQRIDAQLVLTSKIPGCFLMLFRFSNDLIKSHTSMNCCRQKIEDIRKWQIVAAHSTMHFRSNPETHLIFFFFALIATVVSASEI